MIAPETQQPFPRRGWLVVALSGAFCVAFGAFAAHGLSEHLGPRGVATVETGLRYQMFHTAVLAALLALRPPAPTLLGPQCCLIGGMLLFCGSLYLLALTGLKAIAWMTPFGGLMLLAGWTWLIIELIRYNPQQRR